jgi:DNA repair exonuclease SbcCD ATPase subunit
MEETIIAISIRVGIAYFNNTLSNKPISWFAVDEPDKSMDEDNAFLLYKAIEELQSEFTQVFIVTHKQAIKEFFYRANVIQVTSDSDSSHAKVVA